MTLDLSRLDALDADHARAAHAELAAEGFAFLPFVVDDEPWDAYLARIERWRRGDGAPAWVVPWTDLFGVVDGVLVGRVQVRHRLTEQLDRVGGHVGYGIRPAFRRHGYATGLLRAGLTEARARGIDPALVTCDDLNAGSAAVVTRCGGVLEDVVDGDDGRRHRRYRVPTCAGGAPSI